MTKQVFSVRLEQSLIDTIKQRAWFNHQHVNELVTDALNQYLINKESEAHD